MVMVMEGNSNKKMKKNVNFEDEYKTENYKSAIQKSEKFEEQVQCLLALYEKHSEKNAEIQGHIDILLDKITTLKSYLNQKKVQENTTPGVPKTNVGPKLQMMAGFKQKHQETENVISQMHNRINDKMFQTVKAPGVTWTEEEEPLADEDE